MALVLAYMMAVYRISYDEALDIVQKSREKAGPNAGTMILRGVGFVY